MTQTTDADNNRTREQVRAEIRDRYDISEDEQMENFVDEIKEIMTSDMYWFKREFQTVVDLRAGKVSSFQNKRQMNNNNENDGRHQVQIYKVADVYAIRRHNASWGEREVVESLEETNFEWIEWKAVECRDKEQYHADIVKDKLDVAPENFEQSA